MSKAKEVADKAYSAGLNAGRGFIGTRFGAVKGGAGDILKTGWGSIEEEQGLGGVLSIVKNTAGAVKDTFSWNSDRGLLNSINPLGDKPSIFNPFEVGRKLAAGTWETGKEALGTTLNVGKNTVKGISQGVSRAAIGVVTGDYGHYLS